MKGMEYFLETMTFLSGLRDKYFERCHTYTYTKFAKCQQNKLCVILDRPLKACIWVLLYHAALPHTVKCRVYSAADHVKS